MKFLYCAIWYSSMEANVYNTDDIGICTSRASSRTISYGPSKGRNFAKIVLWSCFARMRVARDESDLLYSAVWCGRELSIRRKQENSVPTFSWRQKRWWAMQFLQGLYRLDFTIDNSTIRKQCYHWTRRIVTVKSKASHHGFFLRVKFLPSRTTANIQPCDTGVISCIN